MIYTFTLSILKSMHTLILFMIFYKLYSVATLGYLKPFLLEYYVITIVLTPNLQRVSFYSVIKLLYYSSTTELILPLLLNKRSYLISKALLLCRKSLVALWLMWRSIICMIATRIYTLDRSE